MLRTGIFLLVAMWCMNTAKSQDKSSGGMRLISYNVLHGFNGDTTLMNRFVDWVKDYNPDLVCFQGLNGFNEEKLEALSARYGHPYAVINTGVTHPIGITSRFPIVMVQHVTDNMWHSYLYGKIEGVNVFVTHLAPFTLKDRQRDIKRILTDAGMLSQKEKVLICGDFNSLSPVDSGVYNKSGLLISMQKIEGRLEPKSGTPIVRGRIIYRNNLNNNKIDYSVIQMIRNKGYIDAFYLLNKKFKNSVPTKMNTEKSSKPRRIDYIWVNDVLAKQLISADIIQDDVTAVLSDHYPVFVKFNFK